RFPAGRCEADRLPSCDEEGPILEDERVEDRDIDQPPKVEEAPPCCENELQSKFPDRGEPVEYSLVDDLTCRHDRAIQVEGNRAVSSVASHHPMGRYHRCRHFSCWFLPIPGWSSMSSR